MSLFTDLREVLTPYAQRIKGLTADVSASVSFRAQEQPMYNQAVARENIGAERSLGVEYDDDDNLFDTSTITENKAIWPSDGLAHTQNGYFASDYIDIHDYDSIVLAGLGKPAVYDENKTHIPNAGPDTSNANPVEYDVPSNVYYMRVTAKIDFISTCSIRPKNGGTFKIPKLVVEGSQIVNNVEGETIRRLSDVAEIEKISTLKGYTIPNYAYNSQGGMQGYSNIYCTRKLLIDDSRKITCGIAFNTIALFDANGDFISRVSPVPAVTERIITDDNAVYVSITFNMANYTAEEVENASISGVYGIKSKPVITVGTSGKMFTNLFLAYKFADVLGVHCIINIYEGEYDLYTQVGGSDFISGIPSDASWSYPGVQTIFNNGVTIKGIGNVVLRYEVPDEVYTQYEHQCTRLSPINTRGEIEVDNITFILKNIRYAIHDEYGNNVSYAGTRHKFSNLYVYADNCLACVGMGASASDYIFSDCVFLNGNGNSIYLHTWPNTNCGNLKIENCVIGETNSGGLKLEVYNNNGVFNVSLLSSNIPQVRIGKADSAYTVNIFRLVALRTNLESVTYVEQFDSSLYDPIIG